MPAKNSNRKSKLKAKQKKTVIKNSAKSIQPNQTNLQAQNTELKIANKQEKNQALEKNTQSQMADSKNNKQTASQAASPLAVISQYQKQIIALIVGGLGIAAVIALAFVAIPNLYYETSDYKNEENAQKLEDESKKESQEKDDRQAQIDKNNKIIDLSKEVQIVDLEFSLNSQNYTLTLEVFKDWGEKNYENFLNLVYEDSYSQTSLLFGGFDTGLENSNLIYSVIANDQAAILDPIPDEIWEVAPIPISDEQGVRISNDPIPAHEFYTDYNPATGELIYEAGLLAFQKPTSGGDIKANFFITTEPTSLVSIYTAFAKFDSESLENIQAITDQIQELRNNSVTYELVLNSASIRGLDSN